MKLVRRNVRQIAYSKAFNLINDTAIIFRSFKTIFAGEAKTFYVANCLIQTAKKAKNTFSSDAGTGPDSFNIFRCTKLSAQASVFVHPYPRIPAKLPPVLHFIHGIAVEDD